eukprot:gb/GEZN01001381.1/.p1 GENE.gb/GEZN01001381.1/~~gb/GEZN01001381.1/.p1  ORF type:complete len:874 (+),score=102.83 gb/GEZN01001381.1/:99-2720(+)
MSSRSAAITIPIVAPKNKRIPRRSKEEGDAPEGASTDLDLDSICSKGGRFRFDGGARSLESVYPVFLSQIETQLTTLNVDKQVVERHVIAGVSRLKELEEENCKLLGSIRALREFKSCALTKLTEIQAQTNIPVLLTQSPMDDSEASVSMENAITRVKKEQDRLIKSLSDTRAGLEIADRWWHLRMYPACFVGSEMVDWLIAAGWARNRAEARAIGKYMMRVKLIHHSMQDQGFKDGYHFYRLSASTVLAKKETTWKFSKVIKFFSVGLSSRLAHKIETSDKETQRLVYLNELRQNVVYISMETKTPQGWNLRRSNDNVETYFMQKTLRDPATKRRYNSRVCKTVGRVKIDPAAFVKELVDFKTRAKWDSLFSDGRVVTHLSRTAQIIHRTSVSALKGIAPRDVVCLQDHFQDDGAHLVFEISVEHTEVPHIEGVTRAQVLLLAYVLRPVLGQAGFCDVTFISQVDFKANNVPEWFVDKWMGLDLFGKISAPSELTDSLPTDAQQQEFSGVLIDRYVTAADGSKSTVGTRDFEPIAVLGRGAYSKIVQVKERKTSEIYAMKVLRKNDVIQSRHVRHVMAERNILKMCAHPFIVKLYYSFQTQTKLYMIMDFAAGGDLFTYLRRKGLAEPVACFYTAELVLGLRHIHKLQIAHRDVKPENILFGMDGHILLADFGLSKEGMGPGKRTFSLSGTSEYLAPEMILNKGHGRMVDWWQIGIILHEMLTGKHPFYSQNPYRMHQNVLTREPNLDHRLSSEAKSLLQGFFIKDPSLRLGSRPSRKDIESHAFFAKHSIDWKAILEKKIPPPFKPSLKNKNDVSHFEDIFTQEDPAMSPSPAMSPLAQTMSTSRGGASDSGFFDGFSYDVHKSKSFLKPS